MTRQWETTERPDRYTVRPPAARTAPEIVLRLAETSEVPATARSAQRRAEAAGWAVWPTFARGWGIPSSRRPEPRLVDSLALRCDRLAWRVDGAPFVLEAIGVWLDGHWDVGWVGGPFRSFGQRAWLAVVTDECRGWLSARGIRT